MASKFDKAKGTISNIQKIAQASQEKANLITIKYYNDENLLDYPKNNEDILNTEDIEKSIEEQGFTDPIEITDFGMEDGMFTIISGHRRRVAGRNKGMKSFPCILRHFNDENSVRNYVLFANSQRDSAKDPLLFCKRYKMHEDYLIESGFKGALREEVASRLGISTQQADRYKSFNKIILPVWDMVRDETVGMSSVLPMAKHTIEEQEEILTILKEALEDKQNLTRDLCNQIIKGYREGKKSYLDIIQTEIPFMNKPNYQQGVSVMNVSEQAEQEQAESSEQEVSPLRNNEVNYDASHREGLENTVPNLESEKLDSNDMVAIELASKQGKEDKHEKSEEEKKLANGEKISNLMEKLETVLNDFYTFTDSKSALTVVGSMANLAKVMFAEMEDITDKYQLDEKKFHSHIEGLIKELKSYKA